MLIFPSLSVFIRFAYVFFSVQKTVKEIIYGCTEFLTPTAFLEQLAELGNPLPDDE
jgi:hypothetical protein